MVRFYGMLVCWFDYALTDEHGKQHLAEKRGFAF